MTAYGREGMRRNFVAAGIKVRATYSAEEVGAIAHECAVSPGHYHVANSNVVVEITNGRHAPVPDGTSGKVLVTHFHSYATPFFRYDIGDVATSHERCPCGHDGKTLSQILGRTKGLIKHLDGSLSVFYITGDEMRRIIAFEESRMRQVSTESLVVEIGGRTSLEKHEVNGLCAFRRSRVGADIIVTVHAVHKTDWGSMPWVPQRNHRSAVVSGSPAHLKD